MFIFLGFTQLIIQFEYLYFKTKTKKMTIKNLLILFFIFGSFFSCEKDNNFVEPQIGGLLKNVVVGNEVYYEFTYNNAGFILEEKSKFYYTKHSYNNQNQLLQSDHYWDQRIVSSSSYVLEEAMKRKEWVSPENTGKDSYFSFEYNKSGLLEKRTTNRINSAYKSDDFFTYNQAGQLVKRTSYQDNKVSVIDEYFYDSSGNMKKQERYLESETGTPVLQTTTEYEFDNKHNPYLPFRKLMIPGQNTNPNNIVKETYTLHFEVDNFVQKVQIKEFSYEYNSKEYPVYRSDGFEYVYY